MNTLFFRLGNFFSIFENAMEIFAGNYSVDNQEIAVMKRELKTEDIPTIGSDRQNLKDDASKIVGDYKKAFDAKKEELSLR